MHGGRLHTHTTKQNRLTSPVIVMTPDMTDRHPSPFHRMHTSKIATGSSQWEKLSRLNVKTHTHLTPHSYQSVSYTYNNQNTHNQSTERRK
mmetsp:Transcript_29403/g.73211  ORF Transcript_29403/g.73211 Transcript_29403/m.73211 type:complete len:91 (-) Transcript_29403:1158-1430(-)